MNIWHCFELSWLNNKGKPLIGVLQIKANPDKSIDTKALKIKLNELNLEKFTSSNELLNNIKNYLGANYRLKLILPEDFSNNLPKQTTQHGVNFRFICEQSLQPFFGKLYLLEQTINQPIIQLINSLRDFKSTPTKFADLLFDKINQNISIHFSRKGGISLQALRLTSDINIEQYIRRDEVE